MSDQGPDKQAGPPLFAAQALSVGVAGQTLLEGIDLALEAGDVVAFGGPSGLGKTTLLRTLAGLIAPVAGKLRLSGQPPHAVGWPSYRRRVSYVAQRAAVIDGSVADNLALPFRFQSAGGAALDEDQARALLSRLGLGPALWSRRARELSEGERQRLCLARTLLVKPDVILLDEPTSSLDPESVLAVERELISRDGSAVVLVSHNPAQVQRLGARTHDLTPHAPDPRATEGSGHG